MRIWLIKVGEPLPCDGPDARLMRAGQLATLLAARRHEVTFWSADFDHARKIRRTNSVPFGSPDNLSMELLRGVPYARNVSLARVVNHLQIVRDFRRRAACKPVPDVILCCVPTVGLAEAAIEYGAKNRVPVILDMRDQWPEAIVDLAPSKLRLAAEFALIPMARSLRAAARQATAIVGITPDFVDWGLRYAGRPASELDRFFPQGYTNTPPTLDALGAAREFWARHGLSRGDGHFTSIYVGGLGHQTRQQVETAIGAAEVLKDDGRFRFVIAGDGEQLARHRERARALSNVVVPGWIEKSHIWALRELASVGLVLYDSNRNMSSGWPNKSIEYLAGGVPIVSNLSGALERLITEERCGVHVGDATPRTLASELLRLADNPSARDQLAANARRVYQERFVGERVYAEFCDHIERVARLGPRQPS